MQDNECKIHNIGVKTFNSVGHIGKYKAHCGPIWSFGT